MDSRAGIMNRMWRREIDLIVPAPQPLDRADILNYGTNAMLSSYGQIFTRTPLPRPALQELDGKTVAVLRGDIHYTRFLEAVKAIPMTCQFVEMQRYEDVLDTVRSGHAQAGLVDHFIGDNLGPDYGLGPNPLVSAPVSFHFAVAQGGNALLIAALDEELRRGRQTAGSPYFTSLSAWVQYKPRHSAAALALLSAAGVIGLGILVAVSAILIRRMFHNQTRRMMAANRQLLINMDDHLRRENEATRLKQWFQTLLNNSPDPLLVHGMDASGKPGTFIEVNDTACRQLGYRREELLALSPRDIEINAGADSTPRYAQLLNRWRDARLPDAADPQGDIGSLTTELSLRTKGGQEIPVQVTLRILDLDQQPVVFYTTHDITARRQAQRALKESERRFTDFFTRSPIGVALYSPACELTEVNQAALAMFGLSERSLFAATHLLESSDLTSESRATLLKGGTVRYETMIDFEAAKNNRQYTSSRSGRCHFDLLITNLGLDADYNPKGFMLQIQDVTERRRAEESLLQHERLLRQAQKMEAIGTLAGGIAHDFNNILTPIIGYTEMALLTSAPGNPIRANLDEVLKASHRAKDLVKQILTFSRQTEQESRLIHLIPLIKEVMKLLHGSILSTIELNITISTDRDMVKADPTQIHQIVMNLCTNALHAMREKGGVLDVGINQVMIDSQTRGPLARLRYGAYAEIVVRDSGLGMDRSVMDRIFEPFFTTKTSGEGTGMGLAVVHGLVALLQGAITVESEVGKGSAFHVVLPLVDQAVEPVTTPPDPLPHGTERILFVDDEVGILSMVSQMLTALGYQVETRSRSFDALALFKVNPGGFDLIISDQIMPGMTGLEMIREIHRIRKDIPVILCTGFGKTLSDQDVLMEGVRQVLMKPLILRQLADSIRSALLPVTPASDRSGVPSTGPAPVPASRSPAHG
jgi:PAS domain S-box-containing protein